MNVVEWAEANWRLESGKLIRLRPWQRRLLLAMFPPDGSAPPWETFLLSLLKKTGKTELNAIATAYAALTFPAPEVVYCMANDLEQAEERVFARIARAFKAMGLERRGAAIIGANEILLPETGTRIVALPADFAGAAGAVFGVSSWTELWAYRHEGHVRLWEELTPIPNRRSLRIVDSYAGFSGDSPVLEPLWARALAGRRIDEELPIFTNGKLWALIDQGPEAQARYWLGDDPAEMASYYEEQAASLRPGTFSRLHLNMWASGEEAFVTAEDWDGCVVRDLRPLLPEQAHHLRLSVGVDAATKGDCASVVAVAKQEDGLVQLVAHRIWTPRKGEPLDLEDTVEAYILSLHHRYRTIRVLVDPYQMARSIATLKKAGVRIEEYPQTTGNLTAAGQNLFELIRGRNLTMYPDAELRQHALNAVAIESARGWRLAKEKASRKVDGVVALSFAALDAAERAYGNPMPHPPANPNRLVGLAGLSPARAQLRRELAAAQARDGYQGRDPLAEFAARIGVGVYDSTRGPL
jgi:phage terminase large subunit-like protein